MFPVKLGTGARVETEEVGVEGDGVADGCCVVAGARDAVIELVEITVKWCFTAASERERKFIAVGDFVAEKCVGDYYFGLGAHPLAAGCVEKRCVWREWPARPGDLLPAGRVLFICESHWRNEGSAGWAEGVVEFRNCAALVCLLEINLECGDFVLQQFNKAGDVVFLCQLAGKIFL